MKTYEKIYLELKHQSDYISGETLAENLSVSRTAIWKAIKTLENKGLTVESTKNKGYKLVSGDLYLKDQLEERLNFPVQILEKSQSTQIDAKNGLEKGAPAPTLYLAQEQTAAKGRFGRSFFTDKTGGIYMSLHLKPNCHYQNVKPYTIMVASSLVKAISRLTGIECDIKWVNDIYLNGKKIAGILTEAITSVETGLVTDVIIGVGINFFISTFPENLSEIADSLFKTTPGITREDLICSMWNIFFETPEYDLVKYYKDKSLVLHQNITYLEQEQEKQAKVLDITNRGELLIQTGQEKKTLSSGEVRLISW